MRRLRGGFTRTGANQKRKHSPNTLRSMKLRKERKKDIQAQLEKMKKYASVIRVLARTQVFICPLLFELLT